MSHFYMPVRKPSRKQVNMDIQQVAKRAAMIALGGGTVQLINHKEIHTPNSLVYRLTYQKGGRSKVLYAKMPAEGKSKAQTARTIERLIREYQLSKSIASALPDTPELATVSPAGYIQEFNALLTWEVRGNALQNHLTNQLRFNYGSAPDELHRLVRLSGNWLRRFHDLDLIDSECNPLKDTFEYCSCRLDALVAHENSRMPEILAKTLKKKILKWSEQALSLPGSRLVLCHNDYSPHNIVVTEKGICVLDFSFTSPGLPAFDLACFWHKLEDLKSSPMRGKHGLEQLQTCFLDAYGSDFNTSREDVKLGIARLLLSKMLTLLTSPGTNPLRRLENRRRYNNYLSDLISL
jgi:aminoglycoside phosphotransferase (APT) family kinase protein